MDSTEHYNKVVKSWKYLLGENLHYGYFEAETTSLGSATNALTDLMISKIGTLADDAHILDIGCGTGKPALSLSKHFGCRVTGISPSEVCVDESRELAKCAPINVAPQFIVADGRDIPFGNESVDVVWIMEASHLILEKDKLFKEVFRVLKPGGRVVLCDINLHRDLDLSEVISMRDEFLLLKDCFGRAIMKTTDFYADVARQAFFRKIEVFDVSKETYHTFSCWLDNATKYEEVVSELIGKNSLDDFRQSITVLKKMWQEKILGYFIFVAEKEVEKC